MWSTTAPAKSRLNSVPEQKFYGMQAEATGPPERLSLFAFYLFTFAFLLRCMSALEFQVSSKAGFGVGHHQVHDGIPCGWIFVCVRHVGAKKDGIARANIHRLSIANREAQSS